MIAREILAYVITHAPRGVKGGPYEGAGPPGDKVPSMALAQRYTPDLIDVCRADAAYVACNDYDVRIIRIVRKARPAPSDASAVEVLRGLVVWVDSKMGGLNTVIDNARRVLAASGPDPMPVVRAAMAWRERRGDTAAINALAEAVETYRKAGGK